MKKLLDHSRISAFRLRRHHLSSSRQTNLDTVCRDVCGIQAQLMSAAEIALWTRMHSITRADIDSALKIHRTLVKTSCMRGTLHLVPASDFPLYIRALKRSRLRQMRRVMLKYGGVTQALGHEVMKAVVAALGAGPLTRGELTERVFSSGIVRGKAKKWFQLGWWGVVRQALVEGFVCYGPDRSEETTFVLVDQWLPRREVVEEHRAKDLLLHRYLGSYGPASPQDFSRWSGVPMEEVWPVWKSIEREIVHVVFEGQEGWMLRQDYEHMGSSGLRRTVVRLLPNFDPYMLGHVSKDHLVSGRHYARIYRKAGWISPAVLLDGRIIGMWSYSLRPKKLKVKVELFEKVSPTIRDKIEDETLSLTRFLEGSPASKLLPRTM